MDPKVILYGFIMFLTCLSLHVVSWRIRIPKSDALALCFLFIALPAAFFVFVFGSSWNPLNVSGIDAVAVLVFHFALSLVYISSYPAAQAISPSLEMLLVIASSPDRRLTAEGVLERFNDQGLLHARVDDLKGSVLVSQRNGCLELTAAGKAVIVFFVLYRRLLGLPVGEG